MMSERVIILYQKCLDGTAVAEEKQELSLLLEDPAHEARVKARIETLLQEDQGLTDIPETTMSSMLQAIFQAESTPVRPKTSFWMVIRRTGWAAAAVLAVAATVWWLRPTPRTIRQPLAVQTSPAAGFNKAVLTLANGEVVLLDSAGHRQVNQGTTRVQQQGGQLSYTAGGRQAAEGYNTLSTPRGGQFKVILPDGTAVWLNAASSLRYPVAFTGGQRQVEMAGEAYFEVAPDAAKPFTVKLKDGMHIAVLGTSFNVNAYADEPLVRATLLDGAVNVSKNSRTVRLQPGQQVQAPASGDALRLAILPDASQTIAWKNGAFDFNHVPLADAMRQLARWYDIEVVYEGRVPDITFWGKMGRDLPLKDVLLILEMSQVHCRLDKDGKRLIITP
ncbi:FecR family protein [Chitinophaga qingshengii]|uniref:FecR domain-containing protein n=1 Tax=Chitinophaga qingshengii TaxID=1569794 RepID=A0ABR7TUN1_9BACT|nr:FecR family protein [Chitinophaga qingshengii]MBC9934191.1 FecR domain-containing protein [Chitinophaga qingshengii]